jgi:predicted ATPase
VRQQSLRATIEWSLALLSSPAQQLFSWMGVFAGPVALEVIEAVCEDEIDVLEAAAELLDDALLRRHPDGLELVAALREVASERLAASGDETRVRQAHARVIIATAAAAGRLTIAERADRLRVVALFDEAWRAAAWSREADPRLHLLLATLYAKSLSSSSRGIALTGSGITWLIAAAGPIWSTRVVSASRAVRPATTSPSPLGGPVLDLGM